MTDAQIGERMARVETKLEYVQKEMADLKSKVSDIEAKQDQIISLLTQGKGVVWFLQKMWPGMVWGAALVVTYWTSIRAFLAKMGG